MLSGFSCYSSLLLSIYKKRGLKLTKNDISLLRLVLKKTKDLSLAYQQSTSKYHTMKKNAFPKLETSY